MKRMISAIVMIGAVFFGALLAVPSANAQTPPPPPAASGPAAVAPDTAHPPVSSTSGALAKYNSSTNTLQVCDTAADGGTPYAWWAPGTQHREQYRVEPTVGGNGNCYNYKLTPNSSSKVTFQACNDLKYRSDPCGPWVTTKA